jgi:hypothetical protein
VKGVNNYFSSYTMGIKMFCVICFSLLFVYWWSQTVRTNTSEEHKNCVQNFDEKSCKRPSERPRRWEGTWMKSKLWGSVLDESESGSCPVESFSISCVELPVYIIRELVSLLSTMKTNTYKLWHVYITEEISNCVVSACYLSLVHRFEYIYWCK